MQTPLRYGLNTVLRKYLLFCFRSRRALSFNQPLPSENLFQIPPKKSKRIDFLYFRNQKKGKRRFQLVCIQTERLSKKPLNAVSLTALSVFFSYANRHTRLLRRKKNDGKRFGIRTLALFEKIGNLFLFFDSFIVHTALLCGNVFSALVSSSFQRFSSACRSHSLAEAVNFALLPFFGLIGSFHSIYS